jgi:hypothetical protein
MSDKVYIAHCLDTVCQEGIRHYVQMGVRVTVDGKEYVRVGTVLHETPHDEWRATHADAVRDVANKAGDLAVRLRLQAEHLRRQADAEDEKNKVTA